MSEALHRGGDGPRSSKRGERGESSDVRRPAALEVRFEGSGVTPDDVFVPDLAEVIRAVQRLTAGRIPDEASPLAPEERLRLVKVLRGSAIYRLAGPPPAVAVARLRILGEVIGEPDKIGDHDYLLEPVNVLSRAAAKLGCRISIREAGPDHAILARIGPETYDDLSRSILVTGQTSFSGRVERVGGATRSRCGLRVAFQKRMLICRVPNPEVARVLGENLYRTVVASGTASWIRTTWRVFGFRIESVRPLEQGSIVEMLGDVRDAGGSDWDRIPDVRSFLEGER
jgi:hypothetical protein